MNLSQAIDKAFGSVPRVYSAAALNGVFRYFKADPGSPLVLNGVKISSNSPALVTSTGALAPGVRNCGSPTDLNCVASYNIFASDPAGIGADKAARGGLSKYPAPNNFNVGDGLNQAGYLWNAPSAVRGPRNILRIDHVFNEKNNIFFRAMWAVEQQLKGDLLNGRPSIFPGFPPRGEVYRPAKNYAFSWRHVLSPSTVNELTLGYARFTFLFTYADSNPNFATLPAFTFNNVDVDYVNAPHTQRTLNTPQLIDNVSVTRGAHQLKFGMNMRFYQQNDQSGTVAGQAVTPAVSLSASLNPAGAAFNLPGVANATTAGIASADNARLLSAVNDLLGIPAQLKQAFLGNLNSNSFLPTRSGNYYSMWDVGERQRQYNFFAQDEWRAKRNLTVTYGVRWEINRPPTETSESPYVPNKPIDGSQGPVTFVKANSWYQRANWNALAPRLGVTWSPGTDGKTVVRAGWGIAFDPIPTFQSAAAANTVPGLAYSCTSSTYGPAPTPGCSAVPSNVRLGQGFPQSGAAPSLQPSSFLSPPSQLLGVAPNVVVFDPNLKDATVHQWNLTIQRQLPMGFTAQVGYVGNRGERLYSQVDANQISSGPILNSFTAMQTNVAAGCKPDGNGCPGGKAGSAVPLVANGIVTSAFVNSSSTLTDIQQNAAGNFAGRIEQTTLNAHLRPNQQFSSIIYLSNQADSVYHSLQTTLRRRFAAGLLVNVSYTYGKAIDNMSGDPVGTSYTPTTSTAMDSRNLRLDRGRADFDQRHVMSVTWLYDLPFGRGKKFMHGDSKVLNAALGGWSFQGFNSLMSGEPFSISSGAKTAQYGSNSRAVIVGSGLPDDSLHAKAGAVGPVFFDNTAAFGLAQAGSTGMGRNMFQGPKFWDVDMAMSKSFQPVERLRIVLRAEAFNALNHGNFRKLGSTSVGSTSILSPNFGTACCQTQSTATSTAIVSNGEAYRVVQFVLRAVF